MKSAITPQFSFEELYVPPFRQQRGLNPDTLAIIWVPFKHNRVRTGIKMLDDVVDVFVAGGNPFRWARKQGISSTHLSGFMQIVTGMSLKDFATAWTVRKATQMLLYTELSLDEIMERCGYSDRTNFCRFFKSQLGEPPRYYRLRHSSKTDRQKYTL